MSPVEDAAPSTPPRSALRLYVGDGWPLSSGIVADLPEAAARHAQVRRVQPGDGCTLFDGRGFDWAARVLAVGRQQVRVEVGGAQAVTSELPTAVTLALVVPANERMDTLVEKATELGVAHIQPLMAERSVLRLQGERAERRQLHWQAVAVAACEQSGRATVPAVAPVLPLRGWLHDSAHALGQPPAGQRWLLSLHASARPLAALAAGVPRKVVVLSGPEGGFTAGEEQAALAAGFAAASLGPRVLRADTAPLAVLAWLGLQFASVTS
jgi:16S rRNA (uracil1498-N3)-methyltransferase